MKTLVKNFGKWRIAALAGLYSLLYANAGAQNLGQQVIDSSTEAMRNLIQSIVRLLQVVMGLGALVMLGMVVFKILKGDREAGEKLAWWVAGLTVGFVLLSVVARITLNSNGGIVDI